ncbi:MAG: methyltransferase domain-containing protein, partial [Fervidicoccus fontis]
MRTLGLDFVFCSELLEHLINPDDCLKEIARVLHRRSYMLITSPMRYAVMEIQGRKNRRHNVEHLNVLTYRQFLA